MNDIHSEAASPAIAAAVNAKSPWLGLASFTEETREYFYGREGEVAELARRVQRKLLTILFGQSGLGKTSILRAGLVPRLRSQGFCPVYVRMDYGREAPEPADQIKAAIVATASSFGEWTKAGVAVEGETLWEFLHHRDDVLRDEAGQTLVPLLIFDQFEEIFTLAQTDDFGRTRAARFIEDLSDLVENRAPKELEARLEHDDAAAEKFDFARGDYRVLISLREDYLAPLEGLKNSMPSITQNRLRLAPMTGGQALEAVRRPGGKLISEDVAAAIVRFVAGGAEITNAEVEPSLLSLICRELNDKRIAEDRSEISLDLLAGSHATILAEFYERALADQPAAVRRVIEDHLLTDSGYRENLAESRIVSLFGAAGAPAALALLVNRRLLRIEERLDVRRVELTHDVLCAVVKASRDLRHEREARDHTERLLAEQRNRELAARAALQRARRIAAGCAALALFAVIALAFAFVSLRRAHRAELAAQQSRAAAETARSHAEHLLGYLNDDFAVELAGFGTLGLIKQLGERETQYYDSLPASLQNADTLRSAALARVHFGIAQQQAFDLNGARTNLTSAVKTLEQMRENGDTSEESAIALGVGLAALADVNDRFGVRSTQAIDYNARAEALLRAYADAPNASVAVRRAYGEVALSVGTYEVGDKALALIARAKRAFESIGALQLTDLPASADYANALNFEALELWRDGKIGELKRVSEQGMRLANDVLAQRPGHIVALQARSALNLLASSPAHEDLRIGDSVRFVQRALEDGLLLLRLDPANVDTRATVSQDANVLASEYEELGRPRDARASYEQSQQILLADGQAAANHPEAVVSRYASIARIAADLGEYDVGAAVLEKAAPVLAQAQAALGTDSYKPANARCTLANAQARIALFNRNLEQAVALAQPALKSSLTWKNPYGHANSLIPCPSIAATTIANAEIMLGDFGAAMSASAAAEPVAAKGDDWVSRNHHATLVVLKSIAMSRLGQTAEARKLVYPIVEWQRARFARNHDDARQRLDYASALYALALADGGRRSELLNQAASIIAALPAEMRSLKSTRMWMDRVQAERARATAA